MVEIVHVYLLAVVAFYLWNQSAGLAPVSFLPFWPPLGDFLEETFVGQMGPSFVVPVLIWLLALVAVYRLPFLQTGTAAGWNAGKSDQQPPR